ncbi:SDR family NAD(P)-dependent oxidoreductase [Nitratireductor basaltis]|uniref:Dehydrogenase n=1 Tax=Nitratireductor basaltis TaxID=472175 RepID=A0A084U8U0_9HYPH|nr:SDR family NAD(P)-dependent oxidoreductase [Nitratireductor basaltis]KFB09376.1 Dehydrogenase [Nitratireductor basaltis]
MSSEMFSLAGKTALVIGGSGGIGRELALGFKAAGATSLIAARSAEKLASVAKEISNDDDRNSAYQVNAAEPDELLSLAQTVLAEHTKLDILVNCQGTTAIKPALDLTPDDYDRILDTNLKSTYFACTAFAPAMMKRGSGSIINIASLSAHNGWSKAAAYSASKWGVVGLTKSFAAEWGESGVRVNAIAPGFFLTALNRDQMSAERKLEAEKRASMKRMGRLQELVGAAIFLASPASEFVSGAVLNVDGGYLASGI